MTVAAFLELLPTLLGALFIDVRCLVAVVEFDDGRYVQFWAEGGTSLVAEVIANQKPPSPRVLRDVDESRLMALGWSTPGPFGPNWRFEACDVAQVIECEVMVREVVRSVFFRGEHASVSLRSWSMFRDARVSEIIAREQGRRAYRRSLEEVRRLLDAD